MLFAALHMSANGTKLTRAHAVACPQLAKADIPGGIRWSNRPKLGLRPPIGCPLALKGIWPLGGHLCLLPFGIDGHPWARRWPEHSSWPHHGGSPPSGRYDGLGLLNAGAAGHQ